MRPVAVFFAALLLSAAASAQIGAGMMGDAPIGTDGPKWAWPILWQQSLTVRSFNRSSQVTHNPNYTWWFSTNPSYRLRKNWSLSGNFGFSYEWTNSAVEEFNRPGFNGRDLMINDTRLSASYTVPKQPAGFGFTFRGDLRIPTSEFGRSRKRILSPGVLAQVSRPFEVLHGLSIGVTAAFWGWFARSNVGTIRGEAFPCRTAGGAGGVAGTGFDTCLGGSTSVKHWTMGSLQLSLKPARKLTLATSYTMMWGRAFGLAEACVQTLTGEVCRGDESANNHWRTFSGFNFGISYDITSFLTGTLSYNTWSSHPDSDGGIENPIFNENTRLIFALNIAIDQLYARSRARRARRRSPRAVRRSRKSATRLLVVAE